MNLVLVKNISLVGLFWGNYAIFDPTTLNQSLQTLLDWYAEGKIKPHVSAIYPLEEAASALNAFTQRTVTGKIVLRTRGES